MNPPSTAHASIAVIVPNRNHAEFLSTCLHSILEQASPPDELVIVDDQSTDDSVAIARELIRTVPYARLVENEMNLGTNGALNVGLEHVRSNYVLFLASNDYVMPGIFARAKACLSEYPDAALWSAMSWLVDEGNRRIRLDFSPLVSLTDRHFTPAQCLHLAMRHGNWFTGPTLIYHRETLRDAGGFDPSFKGFSDLLTALTLACRRGAVYSPEPFGTVRLHQGSFMAKTLGDSDWVEGMITNLLQRGPSIEPRLFTPEFLRRFSGRARFAMARTTGIQGMATLATTLGGWRGGVLRAPRWIAPLRTKPGRLLVCFFVLRSFDVVPTIWNRILGNHLVRVRLFFRSAFGMKPRHS